MITNKKKAQATADGGFKLRIWESKKEKWLTVKCGCCNESIKICRDGGFLEINRILAPISEWRTLLIPLLLEG